MNSRQSLAHPVAPEQLIRSTMAPQPMDADERAARREANRARGVELAAMRRERDLDQERRVMALERQQQFRRPAGPPPHPGESWKARTRQRRFRRQVGPACARAGA
ncbi:hypothetical protein [uncultured Thiodictyon sp.]|uniref:hypothetical protein n=1 Tax=uncultured Thiodictyon sp. TaxID=1846217 RepID=UPI0025FB1999|nr:hypothetical protein [uncultured Thiodictyon sp.]